MSSSMCRGRPSERSCTASDDVLRRRQAGGQQQRRDGRGLLGRQALQLDLGRQALGEQAGAPIAERRPGWRLVEPIRGHDQDRHAVGVAGQLPDPFETQVVRPLEVLEDDQGRPVDDGADPVDHVHDERAAVRPAVAGRVGELRPAGRSPGRRGGGRAASSGSCRAGAPRGCRGPAARGRPAASRTRAPGRAERSNARSASCRSRPRRRRAGSGRDRPRVRQAVARRARAARRGRRGSG